MEYLLNVYVVFMLACVSGVTFSADSDSSQGRVMTYVCHAPCWGYKEKTPFDSFYASTIIPENVPSDQRCTLCYGGNKADCENLEEAVGIMFYIWQYSRCTTMSGQFTVEFEMLGDDSSLVAKNKPYVTCVQPELRKLEKSCVSVVCRAKQIEDGVVACSFEGDDQLDPETVCSYGDQEVDTFANIQQSMMRTCLKNRLSMYLLMLEYNLSERNSDQ